MLKNPKVKYFLCASLTVGLSLAIALTYHTSSVASEGTSLLDRVTPQDIARVDELLSQLTDPSREKRATAYAALREMQSPIVPERTRERLRIEPDPQRKVSLIGALHDYTTEVAILALLDELEDRRDIEKPCVECPPELAPKRVCDIAYNGLAHKLQKCGLLEESGLQKSIRDVEQAEERRALPPPEKRGNMLYMFGPKDRIVARDRAILALRDYYSSHWETLLKRLEAVALASHSETNAPSPSVQQSP